MDKVQKIYEEVVRIHNLLPVMDGDNISVNYADRICTTLEMYIDSLQKDHVSKCKIIPKPIECYSNCENCPYSTRLKPVSKDLEEASKKWLIPQLDKSYASYGEAKMMELTHFDGYAMLDAIEFGAERKEEQIKEALLSEVLPFFMHGGEADEVVTKLDEVLNQKK